VQDGIYIFIYIGAVWNMHRVLGKKWIQREVGGACAVMCTTQMKVHFAL
jgi:hypothetical protein